MLLTNRKTRKLASTIMISMLCFNISLLFMFTLNSPNTSDLTDPINEGDVTDQIFEENGSNDANENTDKNISEYEEKYQTFVESGLPDSSYDEDAGFWIKGDPSMSTSDGDVALFGMNDKTVDDLAQMAIAEGLDFIGITNLDRFKVYIPEIGDVELKADIGLTQGAVSNARYTYEDELMIFMGVEKNIGEIDYFGLGKRIKCLLPYDAANELDYITDLVTVNTVVDVIAKMEGYTGSSYFNEKGTVSFCVNEGVLGLWTFLEYQALANSDAPGGVVSVSDTKVHNFLNFDAGASSTIPNWDYYLDEGAGMLGHLGSDAYRRGTGGPGQNVKTYTKVWTKDYQNVMKAFEIGRIFTAQHDVVDGMEFNVIDNYDNIAYMGDTMVSYGEQTYSIDISNNNALQNVRMITNFQNNIQVYKTFTSADFDTSEPGHTKMSITLPHSEGDYFIRLEGIDGSGNRFFSSPIYYSKSDITFPEIEITNPTTEEYHTNLGSINIQWEKSEDLTSTSIDVWNSYWEYEPEPGGGYSYTDGKNYKGQVINIQGTEYSISTLDDGWNTVMIRSDDYWGNTAKDISYIYYHEDIPVVNIFSPLNNTYLPYTDVTINWTASSSGSNDISNFSVWTDTLGPFTDLDASLRSHTFSPGLHPGQNQITVQVFQDGNYESDIQTLTLYVDTTDPILSIDDPINGEMFDETDSEKILKFTGQDFGASGKINRYEVNIYKNDELVSSSTLPADAINCTLPWSDGEFYVNLTIYDEAGNNVSEGLTYYVDYYQPKLSLPKVFYTKESPFDINWELYDTGTWIDTIKLTFNETTSIISNDSLSYSFTTGDFIEEGIYDFSLTVNDSLGHEVTRSSQIVLDTTDPIIYTVWIEDNYFEAQMASYFRVGITMKDTLSNIKNVTLHYSIYIDSDDPLTGKIERLAGGISKMVIEVPLNEIAIVMTSALSLNISFYFEVQNNVDLIVETDEIEYTLAYDRSTLESRLSGGEIAMILSIAVGSTVLIGYGSFKIKRRREFGSLAKYY